MDQSVVHGREPPLDRREVVHPNRHRLCGLESYGRAAVETFGRVNRDEARDLARTEYGHGGDLAKRGQESNPDPA